MNLESPRNNVMDLEDELSANERATRIGFAQGRVVWFGDKNGEEWLEDWFFYLQNEHTLLSMFRGHALHPFDRFDRAMYFVCVACFSLFMSAYVNADHPHTRGYGQYFGWLVISSMLLVAYDIALKFFATCACMHDGGCCEDCGLCGCCRECCVDMGKQGLYICAAGSAGFLVAGIVLAVRSKNVVPGMFFATWIIIRLMSYVGELGPHVFKFYRRRKNQRQYWRDGVVGGGYPLGRDVPDLNYLLQTRVEGYYVGPLREPSLRRGSGGSSPLDTNIWNPLRRASSSSRFSQLGGEPLSPAASLREREQRERERRETKKQEILLRAREKAQSASTTRSQPLRAMSITSNGSSNTLKNNRYNDLDDFGSRGL